MNHEDRTFEQTLRHDNPIVRDHHVHDVRTLPGVTLLDMVYRLAPQCLGAAAIELRQVVFKQPVVTSEEFDKTIVVTFTPVAEHWRITVGSYKSRDGQRLDGAYRDNMECLLYRVADHSPARTLDVAAFIEAAEHRLDMNDVYGLALRADIKHDAFMKTQGTVYSRGSAELMHLSLSDEAELFLPHFHAHPALLDGSTFAGQSMRVRRGAGVDDHTPYIPFTIERFRLHRALPKTVYTYSENEARWRELDGPPPDVSAGDLTLFGADGELLAEFTRFSMKRIRSAALIRSLLEETQGRALRGGQAASPERPIALRPAPAARMAPVGAPPLGAAPTAQPTVASVIQLKIATALKQPPEEISLSDNFYDLGMDSTQLLSLTKELETALNQELYPTLLFEHSSIERLAVYLNKEYDTQALLDAPASPNAASAEEAAPVEQAEQAEHKVLLFVPEQLQAQAVTRAPGTSLRRHVLWLSEDLSSRADPAFEAALKGSAHVDAVVHLHAEDAPIPQQLSELLVKLVSLIKDLVAEPTTEDVLLQLVAPASGERSWATMFSGCFKTLAMEHPRIRSQIVVIAGLPSQQPAAVAKLLELEACGATKMSTLLAYDQELRLRTTRALHEIPYDAQMPRFDFRDDGAYVIAGGLGGLGFILADHLTTRIRPKLALLGRSPLNAAGQQKLDRLTQQGATVRYIQVDLANLAALREAFARVRSEFGSIAAVVHSAGIVKDQVIGRKNLADISAVADAKIAGLWNLDRASAQDELDFFLVFSSLSAVTGNIGQVDYASANAFMDEFAFHRNAMVASGRRHGHSLSMNWPLWAEGGMAIGGGVRLLYQSSGLHPMPSDTGVALIEWALRAGQTQLVVTYGAQSRIRSLIAAHAPVSSQAVHLDTVDAGLARQAADATPQPAPVVALHSEDIAIIGMAGRYPQARDVGEFHRNLKAGRNCITGVPTERWAGYDFGYRVEDYYKFGGFVDGIDEFDALLFSMPPVRAQSLDPQARLFLQTAWEACEDAGYQIDRKVNHYRGAGEQSVGVFVGAFWSHYELFGAQSTARGEPASWGVSLSSISNMTSYCMNFHGPSVAVDTMCSSALTSVHLACESVRRNECHFAIAGGVNLTTHPHKLIFLQQNHFLSSEGVCKSFGENGDGYVPGEGVGAVMLTTVERALRLGYPIRGVIKGSAINHGGKTAGGTVPSPVAQAEVIADALTAANVDPRTLSYVEAHGTGTSLGDPIEIQGLSKAFSRWTDDRQYCAIGSAKSNIGHLEAAAGIAGLTKVLLQFKDHEIYPSLHAEKLNPLIPFHDSPFYVQTTNKAWERPEVRLEVGKVIAPRRALISAFGASGSNASMVLEEHVAAESAAGASAHPARQPVGIVLSARDKDRLAEIAHRLRATLQEGELQERDLPAIACTLQLGRESMEERVAMTAASLEELSSKLDAFVSGTPAVHGVHRGRVKRNNPVGAQRAADAHHQTELTQWIADKAYPQLLAAWVEGEPVDWSGLYRDGMPRRVHLPTYPFARDRHWVSMRTTAPDALEPVVAQTSPEPSLATAALADVQRQDPSTAQIALSRPGAVSASPPATVPARKISLSALAPSVATAPMATESLSVHEPVAIAPEPAAAAAAPDTPAPELEKIKRALKSSLAITLFMDPTEIGYDMPFLDMGMDSIIAVQWVKAVNAEFGTAVKATVLYEHSTLDALAAHLGAGAGSAPNQMPAEAPPASATAAEPPPADRPTPRPRPQPQPQEQPQPNQVEPPQATAAALADISASLRASLAAVLFMAEDEIDDDVTFPEFGMDSIIAVQWVKAVNARHGTALKATVLYEHTHIRALSKYLHEVLTAAHSAPPTLPTPAQPMQPAQTPTQGASSTESATFTTGHWAEDCAYALEGCSNVSVSVVPLALGFGIEMVAAGAGTPAVLLTPMGALATAWMHQVRELSKNHRVMVFHYPGHGRSDFTAARATFAAIAAAVCQALEHIGVDEPFHLVGWSIGALIAQKIVLQHPARIRSLTLISTPARAEEGDTVDATIQVLGNLSNDFAAHVPAAAADLRESQFDFIRAPMKLDLVMPYLFETINFDYGSAARIEAATLIVFGADDSVISSDHCLLLASQIAHSRHVCHELGGHYLPLQNHEWFNEKLSNFFREVERGRHRSKRQVADELPA